MRLAKEASFASSLGLNENWVYYFCRMLRIVCSEIGEPASVLRIEEGADCVPQASELAVKISARPINPSDLLTIRGAYSRQKSPPFIPGYEGVGVVTAVGANVSKNWLGRRVLALGGEGTWQEVIRIPEELALQIPDEIDDMQACQLYVNGLSAWLLMHECIQGRAGEWIVANAANSSLGRILCQISKLLGTRLVAVVENQNCANELLSLGAHSVVSSTQDNLADRVRAITGTLGAQYALDALGGSMSGALSACLCENGKFISYGSMSGQMPRLDFHYLRDKKVKSSFFLLSNWPLSSLVKDVDGAFSTIISLVRDGKIRLNHGKVFPLSQFQLAIAEAESRGKMGKVLMI